MSTRLHIVVSEDLVARIDAVKGPGQPRSDWVRRAVERELAGNRESVHHFSWLAGFIDGEGCFMIAKSTGSLGAYRFQMSIRLRNDDRRVLQELHEVIGVGTVLTGIVRKDASARPNAKPQALWAVSSRADIARVISILDDHPLRSKKARDYAIWREAAQIWLAAPSGSSADWKAIGVLCEKLAAVREYECDGLDVQDAERALATEPPGLEDARVSAVELPAPAEQPRTRKPDPRMARPGTAPRTLPRQAPRRDVKPFPRGS